jgi:PTH1 family peptidyl-tRNA hydrolase
MTLVIGLGNPGTGYAKTKHNFGFWIVDQLVQNRSLKYKSGKGDYLYAKSGNLILAKPTNYMNNSGIAVGEICRYFDVLTEDVIVAYDDIDLPLGTIRLRPSGGTGGHRGVESIIYHLKSEDYNRLRLGIAIDEHMRPAEKYVLKPFPEKYNVEIKIVINHACNALEFFLNNGIVEAMNKFN